MMKRLLVICVTAMSQMFDAQVQNIVPNPSFEFTNGTGCPYTSAGWDKLSSWSNVNMITGQGVWGTPDYFTPCGTGNTAPPNVFSGSSYPHLGNSMAGCVFYNTPYPDFREYLMTPLSCAMVPGITYTVSFWVTNGTYNISPWIIKNIGIHFSNGALSQSTYYPINVVPQCEVTTTVASTSWVNFTFTVNPTSTWNYLTFGAFREDSQNSPIQYYPNLGGNPSAYAYYFVDDIDVWAPVSAPVITVTNVPANALCSGQTATLSVSGAASYTWNNMAHSPTIVVSPTVTTVYTVAASGACGNSSSGSSTVFVNPNPQVAVIGPSVACAGSTVQLQASGANSYSWNGGQSVPVISVITSSISNVYQVIGTNNFGCKASASYTLNVIKCYETGIRKSGILNASVYPNPSSNVLTIRLDNSGIAEIKVITASGGVAKTAHGFGKNEITIPVIDLPQGFYYLMITDIEGRSQSFNWARE